MRQAAVNQIDGSSYVAMIGLGARNLCKYVKVVNDLNVFPIPDGDTGDNMMMTLSGGAKVETSEEEPISKAAKDVAKGMLLSARGNSGVILSQFFAGIADGFATVDAADAKDMENAFKRGVERAYDSVMTPTEGTILTVAKEATMQACNGGFEDPAEFMKCFLDAAKESLEKTPDKLSVLKEAGVVDSGGAGLVYIAEGMYNYLTGEYDETDISLEPAKNSSPSLDLDLFTSDSVLEYGYCTETLLRLQSSKCDVEKLDVNVIRDYLQTIGNSIVCIKDGSIIKIHVHTMTPQKVLDYCQKYGEFLTVKIENMMLQHEDIVKNNVKERTKFGVVTVANGEGIKKDFLAMGADEVIFGGQTMNPSAENFIEAFKRTNADDIFVLPNNGNIIMAAKQAASMFSESRVHVVETHNVGDAYAVLSMLDYSSEDAECILASMNESMEGVLTAEISRSIRDAELSGVPIEKDDYIGILKKQVLSSKKDICDTLKETVDKMDLSEHGLCLVIRGKHGTEETSKTIAEYIIKMYPYIEVVESEGLQDVYDFLIVAE